MIGSLRPLGRLSLSIRWTVAATLLAGSSAGWPGSVVQAAEPPGLSAGSTAQVAVSVATVWTSPRSPRRIDAAALAVPGQPAKWLAGLGTPGRRGLNGRVETQALLGDQVGITEISGSWAKVNVLAQVSPKSAAGYPGWVPLAQLAPASAAQSQTAVVTARRATLFRDAALSATRYSVTYNTQLPVSRVNGRVVEVRTPDGAAAYLSAGQVSQQPVALVTGSQVVREARRFLGLPYLWGGTSSYGFDCSGFAYSIYRHFGVAIPRDATPQYLAGAPVARGAEQPGDLVFFRNSGGIHHVGIYVGGGRMIHCPGTGRRIGYASIVRGVYAREYAGARRFR